MFGKRRLKELSRWLLSKSPADQTEILINCYQSRLTRFANNYIHQNVAELNTSFQIRVVLEKKIGIASANALNKTSLKKTLDDAVEIASHQREDPNFNSLPGPERYQRLKLYDEKTAQFSPGDQARGVRIAIDLAKSNNLNGYGSFSTGVSEVYITNSLGVDAYAVATDVYFNTVMMGEDSTGYADGASRRVTDIDVEAIALKAVNKALLGRRPAGLKTGGYTVILEPLATAELIDFLGWFGFGAKPVQEKRSFLVGKIGKKIVDSRVSLTEDPFHPQGLSFPFDFEGVAKKKVHLIKGGIAKNYVHDSYTGGREGKKSTGNALPAPNPYGPVPSNLVLKGGSKSPERIISETRRGLLVTRFHYTNIIDPVKTIITGMTRDGLFLIRGGEVVGAIKNLRFTESIIRALNNIEEIGRDLTLVGHGPGYSGRHATGTIAPTVKIRGFHFTGVTRF
ncbi:MAG TPA: TldD/PmbA family protein [bacterium (Candidatus Stahlbacteria)]|nr:TldD/PmbA family protein [Candidatus Stahlbacteria bacterium]